MGRKTATLANVMRHARLLGLKLSIGVTTSTADEAEKLQCRRRRETTGTADQRAHVQVPRLVRRDRDDELVVLPVEFDVNAPAAVLRESRS